MIKPRLQPGDPAPWIVSGTLSRDEFHLDTIAGLPVALCFYGSATDPYARRVLDDVRARTDRFDDHHAAFFGVSVDPEEAARGLIADREPGVRFFKDYNLTVSRGYRVTPPASSAAAAGKGPSYIGQTVVLDERLRVFEVIPFDGDPADHAPAVVAALDRLEEALPAAESWAPVLRIPRVFEPEFCQRLIDFHQETGGSVSGFMQQRDGKTFGVIDGRFKRRFDRELAWEGELRLECKRRIEARIAPELARSFQFKATRIERYLIACYDAADGGRFRAHRDNTTGGTAHRQFACSINLNGDFEGGDLRFPEFGPRTYRPEVGGAVIFSCSLLHEATRVTAGRRFAFLPFLYGDEAAEIRRRNAGQLDTGAPTIRQ
jgi:peroxiredoxin/predicted 2-oxoglutarate/Fe(II)-dependent dioxygenase YbiX